MKNNLSVIALGVVSILVLSIASLLSRWDLIGILLGYGMGYINAELLMRVTTEGANLDLKPALRKYRFSFINRLGFITVIIVAVGRNHKDWLPGLAVGLALGLFLSLILKYYQYNSEGKG